MPTGRFTGKEETFKRRCFFRLLTIHVGSGSLPLPKLRIATRFTLTLRGKEHTIVSLTIFDRYRARGDHGHEWDLLREVEDLLVDFIL